jgi:hypothetical protein
MNNQFGGHEGMIATNPSVLQGLDAGGTQLEPCRLVDDRWSVTERSQAIEDRLPVLVAGEIVVGDEELANAGLSAIPGEGDIHAPILRLSLGRVVRCNGARLPEALSRQQVGIYTFRHEINHHARCPLAREVEIV